MAAKTLLQLPHRKTCRDGDDQMGWGHYRADFLEQREHALRLDGKDDYRAFGDHSTIVGIDVAAGVLPKSNASWLGWVAGPAGSRLQQAGAKPTLGQRRCHTARTK